MLNGRITTSTRRVGGVTGGGAPVAARGGRGERGRGRKADGATGGREAGREADGARGGQGRASEGYISNGP